MTAIAFDPDCCGNCAEPRHLGLCDADRCRKAVLPQPATSPLLRLMGEVRVEQTKRQTKKALTVSPEAKAHQARVKNARSVARSKRRGYFGLLKAITQKEN